MAAKAQEAAASVEAEKAKQEALEAAKAAAAARTKVEAAAAAAAVKAKRKKAKDAQKAKAAGGSAEGITTIAQQAQDTELSPDLDDLELSESGLPEGSTLSVGQQGPPGGIPRG